MSGIRSPRWETLAYRRIVGAAHQGKARKLTANSSEFAAILASEHFTSKEQPKKEVALAIED